MKSLRTMALGAALIVGVSAPAAAQATQPGTRPEQRSDTTGLRRPRMWGHGGRALLRGINLTDTQKQQVRAIRDRYRPQLQAMHEQRKQARAQAEGRPQRPDSATMAQFRALAVRQQAEIRAVLTPDQRKVFDQNVARMQERRREMRGDHRRPRGQLGRGAASVQG